MKESPTMSNVNYINKYSKNGPNVLYTCSYNIPAEMAKELLTLHLNTHMIMTIKIAPIRFQFITDSDGYISANSIKKFNAYKFIVLDHKLGRQQELTHLTADNWADKILIILPSSLSNIETLINNYATNIKKQTITTASVHFSESIASTLKKNEQMFLFNGNSALHPTVRLVKFKVK